MEEGMRLRRTFSPKEKLEIILEGVATGNVSETCRRRGITVNLYYEWKNRLFQSADLIFQHQNKNRLRNKIAKWEELLRQKDAVIAEITQENLELKKGRWR